MTDCVFCRIVRRELPADILYEDDHVLAFRDLHPAAPTHVLIIPKAHFATLNDVPADQSALLGALMTTATKVARDLGVDQSGYRVVMNCRDDGGQTVYHIHLHLLAGRALSWPPG